MSRTDKFVNKYKGQIVDVEPGWGFPGECVSLVQRFIIEELNVKAKARGHGKDWRTTLINEGLGYRVDRKDIRKGDIIAWDGKLGHVAISLGGDKIFEQEGGSKDTSAKIASAKAWDNRQGNKGVVTRLYNFKDVEEKPKNKTNKELAQEVMQGKWGNGADRKNRLEKAGYNYNAVQKEVNKLVSNKPAAKPKLKSNAIIAQEIMAGKWGNGQARKNALEKAGYNYKAVQKEVDKLLTKKPTTSKPKVERATVGGKHYLYKNHTGTDIYGSGKQNLKSRNMEVLERRNGRVRVDAKPYFKTVNGKKVPVFDVDSFWVKL